MKKDLILSIKGMSCAACVARLEKTIGKVIGVEKVSVSLATEKANIYGDADVNVIISAIVRAGFEASVEKKVEQKSKSKYNVRFIVSAILTIIVVFISMGAMLPPLAFLQTWQANPYIQWLLSSIVLFYGGYPFYSKAIKHITKPDMNSLVTLGTMTAYIYSIYLMYSSAHAHLYFEATTVIITFVLLGRSLEARAKSSVAESINSLMDLIPQTAILVMESGQESVVKSADLKIGNNVLLKAGASVASDGVILSGDAILDEAMLTGEATPIKKTIGDLIYAGTICSSGAAVFKVTKESADTALAAIIKRVEEATANKAKMQRLADYVASIFVPTVLGIAVITFIIWYVLTGSFAHSLIPFVSVLVIACPCALGLAIPTAIIAAVGKGAKLGLLIKNGEVLERVKNIDTFVFDKTGTLTDGKFTVTKVETFNNFLHDDIIKYAASIEGLSEHLLSLGVMNYAGDIKLFEVKEFETIKGFGVRGIVNGKVVLAGSFKLMNKDKIEFAESSENSSVIYLAIDGVAAGILTLGDNVRKGAAKTIEKLSAQGVTCSIVSGDNYHSVQKLAGELGVSCYSHGITPSGKQDIIKEYQSKGKKVAMVGDGINDAAALSLADISISFSSATDVAVNVSDIVIVNDDITKLVDALHLAKRSNRIIKENLFWAFGYNVVAIPLAAFGFLSPTIAGIAMAFSSVSVVANSLRLK